MTTLLMRLGEFAASLSSRSLPPEVLHHARRAVIDWTACTVAGARAAPGRLMEEAFADELDHGPSRLILGRPAASGVAALINGTAAHTVEFDDIYKHAIYHPGAPTIAAALAMAQARGADGPAFLRAVIAGYEISTRIGAVMGRAHYRYWHNTGTIGCFGAAPAAGVLLGLTARQHAHAMATVATFAAGLQQAFKMDSHSKPLHAGHAAQAGLQAARMAGAGVIGSLDVLDGASGMGVAMSDSPDWGAALTGLGSQWNITEMTFKNHGCCGHAFAAIDGALVLRERMAIDAAAIRSVAVATYGAALEVANIEHPRTESEARFSLRYVVACALIHGSVRLDAMSPERLASPAIRELMTRISVSVDPAIDQAFPGRRAAHVTITDDRGRTESFFQPTRVGDPDAPLSDRQLDDKFLELSAPVLGDARAHAWLAGLWALDQPGTAFPT
ncbi:MAG TPA: MmgE/PrpD family protein [Burkholderiaceae bacterium]|jgi:2-methylcitrate dehydratase PrpD|nr:MmgE/PrpD family protein [Burkholderiaceae bacterium]